jgi:hypothetical protein
MKHMTARLALVFALGLTACAEQQGGTSGTAAPTYEAIKPFLGSWSGWVAGLPIEVLVLRDGTVRYWFNGSERRMVPARLEGQTLNVPFSGGGRHYFNLTLAAGDKLDYYYYGDARGQYSSTLARGTRQ